MDICTGPLEVRKTGLSSEGSAKSPLSSFSLISASSLLSLSEKIPPSLFVMLCISPSGSVSDSPCILPWWLNDSVIYMLLHCWLINITNFLFLERIPPSLLVILCIWPSNSHVYCPGDLTILQFICYYTETLSYKHHKFFIVGEDSSQFACNTLYMAIQFPCILPWWLILCYYTETLSYKHDLFYIVKEDWKIRWWENQDIIGPVLLHFSESCNS